MKDQLSDQDKQAIRTAADALSLMLQDVKHKASNRTRLLRLYQASDLSLDQFMTVVRRCYSKTLTRLPGLRRPMAWLFTTLEGELSEPVAVGAERVGRLPY